VLHAAEASGKPVVVAGNSLGAWTALRLAGHEDVPVAGVVAIGPAGIRMAPLFFAVDRIPAVSRLLGVPAPVPEGVVRGVAAQVYRRLAFGNGASMDQAIVDRFTRFTTDRSVINQRINYAKRIKSDLDDPFEAERIKAPVTVLWGDRDRLCLPDGAERLREMVPHADIEMLPGIGHCPQLECPEVVADAIEAMAA
jgi:pimeloyl-ACP methyl ester carboxylesterase